MKTMALFYPGCIEFEVMLACEILNPRFPVEVVTPDGKDHIGSNGITLKAVTSIHELDKTHYKVALIPGGNPDVLIGNAILSQRLRELHENGAILAAICAGPVLLEQAGLLAGQRIAHGYKGSQLTFLNDNGFFKNTILTDEAVVVENNIITARPDSFIDFAVDIAVLAGVFPASKAEFWKHYYRGRPN
jgi:4-methyl-5(b-hydroxyethyl)-thiazole monophosphate biosynthesis